jgi:ankyrin repeat protein
MSNSLLPQQASLEYVKKEAKDRLRELRVSDPTAKLTAAQLAVARNYGFSSWRELKFEVERVQADVSARYFDACTKGDVDVLRVLLRSDPTLVRRSSPTAPFRGWTGLHEAAKRGQLEVVRVLLAQGADPNARESGDNTYPLHWAAGFRHTEVVRALLDAGAEIQGEGDLHALDTIGWATFFRAPGAPLGDMPATAELLVERGAKHHIFSAMSLGDLDLLRTVIERDRAAIHRKMSKFEGEQTALHFALSLKRYDMVGLLLERGAALEGKDKNGLTPLESAMMIGDQEGMALLTSAGAKKPKRVHLPAGGTLTKVAASVTKVSPMIYVPDVLAALEWYVSIGFQEAFRVREEGIVNFGIVRFGQAEMYINMNGKRGHQTTSLWFSTDRVDDMYLLLKSRQIGAAVNAGAVEVEFIEHINDTIYGARQFCIRDLNGYLLYFIK